MKQPGRGVSAVLIALCATTYVACVGEDPAAIAPAPAGDDSGLPSGGDGGGAADSGLAPDAAPPLGCPQGCLPPAPAGWTGPSAVYDGPEATRPTACSAPYTQQEIEAHQGMTAAAAVCSCGAPAFQGAKCTANVLLWSEGTCSMGLPLIDGTATAGTVCHAIGTFDGNTDFIKLSTPTLTRGTCTYPAPPAPRLTAPTFQAINLACGLPQAAACGERAGCTATPAPAAPFSRVCIHQEGDALCPSADYAKRFVAFRKLTDERRCEPCVGVTSDGACGTKWGISPNTAQCVTDTPMANAGTACVANPGVGGLINIKAMAPTGITCTSAGGTPKGAASSSDAVTFCCNE